MHIFLIGDQLLKSIYEMQEYADIAKDSSLAVFKQIYLAAEAVFSVCTLLQPVKCNRAHK